MVCKCNWYHSLNNTLACQSDTALIPDLVRWNYIVEFSIIELLQYRLDSQLVDKWQIALQGKSRSIDSVSYCIEVDHRQVVILLFALPGKTHCLRLNPYRVRPNKQVGDKNYLSSKSISFTGSTNVVGPCVTSAAEDTLSRLNVYPMNSLTPFRLNANNFCP